MLAGDLCNTGSDADLMNEATTPLLLGEPEDEAGAVVATLVEGESKDVEANAEIEIKFDEDGVPEGQV